MFASWIHFSFVHNTLSCGFSAWQGDKKWTQEEDIIQGYKEFCGIFKISKFFLHQFEASFYCVFEGLEFNE